MMTYTVTGAPGAAIDTAVLVSMFTGLVAKPELTIDHVVPYKLRLDGQVIGPPFA